jgi:hypothetical protein
LETAGIVDHKIGQKFVVGRRSRLDRFRGHGRIGIIGHFQVDVSPLDAVYF